MAFIDLTGQRFGRLKVIGFAHIKRRQTHWNCVCDCGNQTIVGIGNLKNGSTKSCGCLKKEKVSQMFSKHGYSTEKLYKVWKSMRKRCKNPNDKSYKHYGAKGVCVCKEWENYELFREWAYQNGYVESETYNHKTIDRINPYGNYEPNNCRIVDWVIQRHNRREHYGK